MPRVQEQIFDRRLLDNLAARHHRDPVRHVPDHA